MQKYKLKIEFLVMMNDDVMETPENKVECATLLLPANKSEAQPASPMVHRATTSITIPPVMQDILVVILFE